jgi:hypothetical protein
VQNAASEAGGDADAAALEEEAAEEFLLLDDVVAEVRVELFATTLPGSGTGISCNCSHRTGHPLAACTR